MIRFGIILLSLMAAIASFAQEANKGKRARDYGVEIGVMPTGRWNAITDVQGVKVGHTTIIRGDTVHTGVTAVLPHGENIFQHKVPAGVLIGNGFGKLTGSSQIEELGNIETPIILTNTLSVGPAVEAVVRYTLLQEGNEKIQSVNAVVGETNDGTLNDIRGMHVSAGDIISAISAAESGEVAEGNVGAGAGTVCFGFKGGIGTSSRKLPSSLGGYTVGVLVQSNYGGILQINGAPVGAELQQYSFRDKLLNNVDGSCMVIVATDAPLDARNLKRLAHRAFLGLGKTGGIASNGSGEYFIAFSTNEQSRIPHQTEDAVLTLPTLQNDFMSPLFMAVIEATEEAVINSLFAAETVKGHHDTIQALPKEKVLPILEKYNAIKTNVKP
ncbi:MAG TPA: P1 family peptidase [Sphingobacterium sp.]|jgi:D-aminopeptidase|nr:P1 family peptidase [Sphingobacterium sp.]